MKRILQALFLTLLLSISPCLLASVHAQGDGPDDYSIRLRGTDGKDYDLSNMRGQIILVSFGATWCVPCKEELRALEELKNEYRDKPVRFFWVSVDDGERVSDKELTSFARSIKFTFPILRDTTRWTYAKFSTRQRIPLVVFFDKQGRFMAPAHAGMSSPDNYKRMIRSRLDALLGNQSKASTGSL